MHENNEYAPVLQPDEIGRKERDDAMGSYLMMFASTGVGLPLPIINLIASIIYFYVNKGKGRFVHFHSLQSLLSQLPVSLITGFGVMWFFRTIFITQGTFTDVFWGYICVVVLANLLYFIFSIVGAAKAYNGKMYYFLFFGKIAYHYAYRQKPESMGGDSRPVNRPPSF